MNFVRRNSEGDTVTFRTSLCVSLALTGGFLVTFSLLRLCFPAVYTRAPGPGEDPRRWRAGAVSGVLDWLVWVWRTSPEEEVRAAGLDGWSIMEFFRLSSRIFLLLAFLLLAVLCPIHYVNTSPTQDFLSRLDVGSLPAASRTFWLHAVLVWVVVLVCNSLILQAHQEFLARRFEWLKAIPAPRANTLMVENIPQPYRSDEALKAYFMEVFREDAIESAYVVRKTPKLLQKLGQLTTVKYLLMLAQSALENAGQEPSDRVERRRAEVERFERLREEALTEVAAEMACVELAMRDQDSKVVSPAGFVTFTSEFWQRLASREQYRADVAEFAVSMPPDPEDVLWQDLAQDHLGSRLGEGLGWTCLVLIFLFWSPVVVFISTLTTLHNLARWVPIVSSVIKEFPFTKTLIQGFLATAALRLLMFFLPNILMYIIRRFFTLKAGTRAQLQLQRWYYAFLLLFVLLVTIVGRSILLTVTEIASHPTTIVQRLALSLPSASHFYLSYVALGWFTLAFELLRFTNLTKYAFFRFGYLLDPATAKEYSEPENEDAYGVGARMGMAVLMCSIALVFCTCSPLIIAIALVYFFIGRYTYGYLLVHAESKKPDLGGRVFVEALQQLLLVLVVFVLLMTGVLLKNSGSDTLLHWRENSLSWRELVSPPVVSALALLCVHRAWKRLHSLAWDALPLEEVAKASRAREAAARREGERPVGRYVQRECDLELLLEDAEKVAITRARAEGGLALAVHGYVRTAADLVDFGSTVTRHGTESALAVVNTSWGAMDAVVNIGPQGAVSAVDRGSQAAIAWLARSVSLARNWTQSGRPRIPSGGSPGAATPSDSSTDGAAAPTAALAMPPMPPTPALPEPPASYAPAG